MMMRRAPGSAPIRVLVVDDSPTVRAVVRRLLAASPELEVVGEAGDGEAAVVAVESLQPGLVLMDLEMPRLDGIGAITRIMASRPTPVLVLTSRSERDTALAFRAMRAGAVDLVPKPLDPEGWQALRQTLPELAVAATEAFAGRLGSAAAAAGPRTAAAPVRASEEAALGDRIPKGARARYLAVGASTGGPVALHELLASLPADPPTTVLVVQHITPGFEAGLAEWLARDLRRDVRVASDGEEARTGVVRLAPTGAHLVLAADGRLRLDTVTPPRGPHRPAADELFASCARVAPRDTVGILLTGMGRDGAAGLLALRRAGGLTMVQDETSAAVFGMPRAALEQGAAELVLAPRAMGRLLGRMWGR